MKVILCKLFKLDKIVNRKETKGFLPHESMVRFEALVIISGKRGMS